MGADINETLQKIDLQCGDIIAEYSSLDNTECFYNMFGMKKEGCSCQMGTAALDLLSYSGNIGELKESPDNELITVSPLFCISAMRAAVRADKALFEYTIELFKEFFSLCEKDSRYMTPDCLELFLMAHSCSLPAHNTVIAKYNDATQMLANGAEQEEITEYYLSLYIDGNIERVTTYYCGKGTDEIVRSGIYNAVASSIYECLRRGKRLKKCELCGKWFFPVADNREKYCSREIYGGKSCKEHSSTARELNRRSGSEIERKLHTVRQTLVNCGKFAEKELFNEGVKVERQKYKAGIISESDFLAWIEENRHPDIKGGGDNGKCN